MWFLKGFLSLLFPLNCLICRRGLRSDNRKYLCPTCWREIRLIKEPVCSKCGRPSSLTVCSSCQNQKREYFFSKARAAGVYEGVLRECIHFFKYRKKAYLARPLGELLIDGMSSDKDLREADFLVPVPLDGRRYREREFNQAHLLAQVVSRYFKIPISSRNLRRVRGVPPQTQLSRKEREENVKGLFQVPRAEEYEGRRILLIDDVFTTGSTVNECARVLKQAGAEEVSVLTVARGE